MDDEVELVSDGEGLAILGKATDVERFLLDHGWECDSETLDVQRLRSSLGLAGAADQAGAAIKGAATGLAGAFGTLFQRRVGRQEGQDADEPS